LIETERDLKVINLAQPEANEITVQFQQTQTNQIARPAGLTYDDGEPNVDDDARIAVRFEGQSDVILIEMIADDDSPFKLLPQLVDAGGVPGALELVRTDQGVRLAALLPQESRAALINPSTTLAELIDLPAPFSNFTLLNRGDDTTAGDEALLWGPNVPHVAFWTLGETGEQAFRSVEGLELQVGVSAVVEVPGDTRRRLLRGGDNQFVVLDLDRRQAFPMTTQFGNVQLSVSADGLRAWAFQSGAFDFGMVDLQTMHVTAVRSDVEVDRVFDLSRGNRSLAVALHTQGGIAATVFDAENPDATKSRFHGGVLLGGM
jgi:hypothetical protein